MLQFIALQIARILFALRSVRPHHMIFAWLAVLTFARTPAYSALATFIAANGTTAQNWNIGGPNGPNWTNSSGTSVISAATKMSVDGPITAVGPSDATEIDIGNSLTEPTINIGDQTANAAGVINLGPASFATTTASVESVSINTGTAGGFSSGNFSVQSSTFCMNEASTDFLLLGGNTPSGSTTELLPTGVNVANGTAQLTSSTVTIGTSSAAMSMTTTGGAQIGSAGVEWNLSVAGIGIAEISGVGFGPVVNPNTLACGTGGTKVVAANTFGVVVTTGTLTSNCILDFSTNAYSGLYLVDLSGATPGASFGIQFKNGSATNTYLSSGVIAGTLATVWTHGTNTLAVSY
ncbi:MAG: hypothetical protein ACLPWF_26740 [Bryobacteraceae bacterium]